MPEFAFLWVLLLLLLLPLVAWRWRRRTRAALRYSDLAHLPAMETPRARRAERGGLLLRLSGLCLLTLAAAGPRWPDEGSRIVTEGISLAFVLDVSSSMAQRDLPWNDESLSRLAGAQRVFTLLVAGGTGPAGTDFPGRPQDLIMLVTFATRPETACPLTLDHAALIGILQTQEPRTILTEATTNPGDAIAWALYSLQRAPTRRRALILLTDGESNVPPPALTPRQAAQLAGNLGVPIYAIDAAPADETAEAARARATLTDIARMTDGGYFPVRDGAALAEAVQRIDQLERDRIESFRYRRYTEDYPWLALAGLFCWLAVLLLEATIWRRTP